MASPSVAVVTVTHDSAAVVPAMLASVRGAADGRDVPVIAVDNGSRDATVALLRGHPGVRVVEQANTGYAHGVNRGIAAAPPGHDVLVLNPDVRLAPGALDRLAGVLAAEPTAGIVVPCLQDPAGEVLPSLRRRPSAGRVLVETIVGGRRAGRFGECYAPRTDHGPQTVAWATGAAMLLRREALDRLGPLAEGFFLYSEETEYCLRAGDAGFRVLCEPAAVVTHIGGEMARRPDLWALRAVNRVRLQRDRHGPASAWALRSASLAFELRRAVTGDEVSRAAVQALLRPDVDATARTLMDRLGACQPTEHVA